MLSSYDDLRSGNRRLTYKNKLLRGRNMEGLFVAWTVVNIFAVFILAVTSVDGVNPSFVNPIVIYNNIKINWFGAWLLAIMCNVALPAIAIPYWIYKICTVGRE